MKKNLVYFGLFVVLVIIGLVWYVGARPGEYDSFAQCLTDKGIKMYGAYWCPHCAEQKELFGSSWKYIDYIECSNTDRSQTAECIAAQIKTYPTWEFAGGKRVDGGLAISQLAVFSGCATA